MGQFCESMLLVDVVGRCCCSVLLVGVVGRCCWSMTYVDIVSTDSSVSRRQASGGQRHSDRSYPYGYSQITLKFVTRLDAASERLGKERKAGKKEVEKKEKQ